MPEYLVTFANRVITQPDHILARRELTELCVQAETETGALIHALRVTQGDPGECTVGPAPPITHVPAVEVGSDRAVWLSMDDPFRAARQREREAAGATP